MIFVTSGGGSVKPLFCGSSRIYTGDTASDNNGIGRIDYSSSDYSAYASFNSSTCKITIKKACTLNISLNIEVTDDPASDTAVRSLTLYKNSKTTANKIAAASWPNTRGAMVVNVKLAANDTLFCERSITNAPYQIIFCNIQAWLA